MVRRGDLLTRASVVSNQGSPTGSEELSAIARSFCEIGVICEISVMVLLHCRSYASAQGEWKKT